MTDIDRILDKLDSIQNTQLDLAKGQVRLETKVDSLMAKVTQLESKVAEHEARLNVYSGVQKAAMFIYTPVAAAVGYIAHHLFGKVF